MIIDEVGRHLRPEGDGVSFERAAAIPGMFLAWCVNMGLISDELARDEERVIVRLKYREITGGEFLVSACGGTLDARKLSASGLEFASAHYAAFETAAREMIEAPIDDKWANYDKVAPWLTKRYLGRERGPKRRFRWKWWR